jgi:cell filamentation protein, protein adenylyltransferase
LKSSTIPPALDPKFPRPYHLNTADYSESSPGELVEVSGPSGRYWAFVPRPLPRRLEIPFECMTRLSEASTALGELKGVGRMLPNPNLLIGSFLRREAVSSSRIEGIKTSFQQLLLFEMETSEADTDSDPQEVFNYVNALRYGLERLKTLPVSLRLIREMHERLMRGVRGEDAKPGEFRDRQNMIARSGESPAQARFVPPPVPQMRGALDDLEQFIAYPPGNPILIDLALIHYQFETIHPFLDGNGRMGRLMISLLLCERGCLTTPLLYLSSYFERHKDLYVDHLLSVSRSGDWTPWLEFFLKGVSVQSRVAIEKAGEILDLWKEYRETTQSKFKSANILRLVDEIFVRPAISIRQAAEVGGVTFNAALRQIEWLEGEGVLREVTGRSKNRVYVAEKIVEIIARPEVDDPAEPRE